MSTHGAHIPLDFLVKQFMLKTMHEVIRALPSLGLEPADFHNFKQGLNQHGACHFV